MRAQNWLSGLGLVLASLWTEAGLVQNAPAAPSGQFSFVVCNKSGMDFYFAFISRATPADLQYRVSGWWPSKAGGCQSPGNFAQGRFYYFAYNFAGNSRNVLEGTAVMQCLPYYFDGGQATNFNQVIAGDAQCDPFPANAPFPPGKYLQGFVELIVPVTMSEYACQLTSTQPGECLQ